ncbi:MAG: xanthine dehydrogenase family protein molybdopterin-binding subunit [Novosphingobium sp.]|uniref:xanthine dehydrogenase family protein molybdopterin-binding subunit n=1 Tax=Novosphingobium sp. TaxID=1874826 RepID=UPI0012CB6343|nr:xanthine dehydrogenase family protein molybdopterin-binding subunit [Novosphingobium sp.]MPS68606.1 xanthine dehydrogenase family protein molybdopterin-binding subunit [Novosphingobium sp.]
MNAEPSGIGAARWIGKRVPRKEDARLLTGRGQFTDDVVLPGMLHVAFVRSPVARGRLVSIDGAAAVQMPGVHAVLTAADLALRPITMMSFFFTPSEVPVAPLADTLVQYVGEPVAMVMAETRAQAEDAASLVEVEIEELEPVVTLAQAKAAAPIHPGTESNVAAEIGDEELDEELEAALSGAALRVSQKVVHQRISQSPMENRAILASRDGPEELNLWITCQSPHNIARWVSLALGLPDAAIRVIAKDVGGSFGLKNTPWKEECAVICAAMLLGRPLKWTEDRYEALTASSQCREAEMSLQAGFDGEGRLIASHGIYDCNNGAYPQGADSNIAVHMFVWAAYRMPAYAFVSRGWYSNTNGLAAYRGPWAMESLIRETLLDKAARKLGIDPIELRRRNLVYLSDQPAVSSMGIPLEDITPGECLEKLVAHFDVAAFRREQAKARGEGRYLGLGVAAYIEPTGSAGSMVTMTGELAQVRIEPTGKVTALMSTHSQGHGTATTMAQCIADRLGVAYDDVTVFEGDSSRGGFGPGAAGSRQGVIGGGAAIRASELLADKVKVLAAHLYNASIDTVTIEDGMVHIAGAPEMSRSLGEIANIAYGEPHRLPPGFEAGLEAQFRYQPPPMTFTSAAHACVVEVDAETGFVKILRWISSEDCGTVINPGVVEGQISGGLAQAIGMVLLEEMPYDARGNPQAATFKDYLLPSISDVPVFEFVHANTPSQTIGGMRGVGEGGAIIGPPTLVNAIADALSPFGEIEDLVLPLTPARILDVIEQRDVSGVRKDGGQSGMVSGEAPAPVPAMEPVIQAEPVSGPESEVQPAGLDGDWNMVLKTPMGPQAMVVTFRTEGAAVSGRFTSPEGTQDFEGGTVDENRVRFDLKVEKPMKITLKYDLTVTGNTIAGKCKMGMFGSAKVTGERAG